MLDIAMGMHHITEKLQLVHKVSVAMYDICKYSSHHDDDIIIIILLYRIWLLTMCS